MDRSALTTRVKQAAHDAGFDLVGIAPAVSASTFGRLTEWIGQGFAGEMQYIPRREAAYEHPSHVLANVKTVIMLGLNYHTRSPENVSVADEGQSKPSEQARVARYAQGTVDYHDLIRTKHQTLADSVHTLAPGCRTRGVVDTAPLLERDFAKLAGLGWFGKNTMLINKRMGSWLFLAALLTDLDLEADSLHETSHCGTCTRCLDVCPTDAFVAPYVLDARRCISYLTIELRKPIPEDLREGMGNWIFGCDLCQDVCPWNRKAPVTSELAFQPQPGLHPANAAEILQLSLSEFQIRFEKTPLGRPGWEGLRRNAAIVLGNSRDPGQIPMLTSFLSDPSANVRDAVDWAIKQLKAESCQSESQA